MWANEGENTVEALMRRGHGTAGGGDGLRRRHGARA